MLSTYTEEQFTVGNNQIISKVTVNATSYYCHCTINRNYAYHIEYSINTLSLTTKSSDFHYLKGDSRNYAVKYVVIDEKEYLSSITEFIQGNEYYSLYFDYSRFEEGEIKLSQTLFGKERFRAKLQVIHNNPTGIPDVHLFDADFHPLSKHVEAVCGGLFGSFDYLITTIEKETDTEIFKGEETILSAIEWNRDGYPLKITSVSDKKGKATKYYEFDYKQN